SSTRYNLTPTIDAVMLSLLSLIIASGTVLRADTENVDVPYTAEAEGHCCTDNVTDIRIFVILARRINTTSNQNITSQDL
ncbi:hypothetical protein TELCIR_20933, partial [Teladorsagia circumcincta]